MCDSIECTCPHCLVYGVAVTMHLDLTGKEPIYHCPCCGNQFSNSDLMQIYEQKLNKGKGGNYDT
ncbi:MAG: hypothetical protein WBB67_14330 [bacterium]